MVAQQLMQKNYKSLLKRNIKGVNFYVDNFSSSDIYFENNNFNTEIDIKANKYCPLSIKIELLNNSNFNCGFCYIHNRNFSKQIDFNQLISILKLLIKKWSITLRANRWRNFYVSKVY